MEILSFMADVCMPVGMLLALSFFVLFFIGKGVVSGMRVFGYVILFLLWFSAGSLLFRGTYALLQYKNQEAQQKMSMAQPKPGCAKMQQPPLTPGVKAQP